MGVKGSDITISRNDGIQAWPTIIAFAESPKRAGPALRRHRRRQRAGVARRRQSWTNVTDKIPKLPKGMWVLRGRAVALTTRARVYATFDGHRQNDFETYIYVSARLRADVAVGGGQPEGRDQSRR